MSGHSDGSRRTIFFNPTIMDKGKVMTVERVWQDFYDSQVRSSIEYPQIDLSQLLQTAVEENPSGTATMFFGAKLSYRNLSQSVDQFARGLNSLGIEQGDRVALILPNLPVYPIAHFAIARIGAIVVPTNPLYVERELEYQLNDSGARAAVVFDQLAPRLRSVQKQTGVKDIIVAGVQDFLPWPLSLAYRLKNRSKTPDTGNYLVYKKFMSRNYPEISPPEIDSQDTAILLYTGGTTGVSKGAELTHKNIVSNVYQTGEWLWGMQKKNEKILCVLPFFHSYGMTTGMHLAVLAQSAMLLLPRFELADVAKAIKKYKPTIFCAVPSLYNAVNRYRKLTREDLSSIRLCVSGGAPLPAEVQERFEALTGGKLVEGYGLTETSPVALVNPTHGHRKNGTIGVPVSDTDAEVVDPETHQSLPAGQVGELALRGPQVMKGYWNIPEETARVLQDGWLFTGDLSVMDEEGFFRIVDRKKDLIISAGMNIYPREIEEVLHQHPKIVEVAVVGSSSKVREEVVKAYIVVEEGKSLTKAEVVEFCRDKLAKYKIPRQVQLVAELPKSAMGKVLKRSLEGTQA